MSLDAIALTVSIVVLLVNVACFAYTLRASARVRATERRIAGRRLA